MRVENAKKNVFSNSAFYLLQSQELTKTSFSSYSDDSGYMDDTNGEKEGMHENKHNRK